jgi:hypothetical protein
MLPLRFRPLDMATDPPRPGMLLAIDAEFVALTPLSDARAIEGGCGQGQALTRSDVRHASTWPENPEP